MVVRYPTTLELDTVPTEETHAQKLARHLLEREPGEFINDHRRDGLSWRRCATALALATAGEVTVGEQAVHDWWDRWNMAQRAAVAADA